jgi:hypothetical protein
MRIAAMRAVLGTIALAELVWSVAFYFRPDLALGVLGRAVIDPVIARQYPVYLVLAKIERHTPHEFGQGDRAQDRAHSCDSHSNSARIAAFGDACRGAGVAEIVPSNPR